MKPKNSALKEYFWLQALLGGMVGWYLTPWHYTSQWPSSLTNSDIDVTACSYLKFTQHKSQQLIIEAFYFTR